MAELLDVLIQDPHWVFIILGCSLLIVELFGTLGYALWCGISAFIVSLIAYFVPMSWSTLWIVFSLLSLVIAYLWWLWLRRYGGDVSEDVEVNTGTKELIGIKTVAMTDFINGNGRVKIKDGSWLAQSDSDIQKGTAVEVLDISGMKLIVRPIQ